MTPESVLFGVLIGTLVLLTIFVLVVIASTRGVCIYCHQRTGFWRSSHPRCREQRQQEALRAEKEKTEAAKRAVEKWTRACRDYYADRLTGDEIESIMDEVSSLIPTGKMQRIADKCQAEFRSSQKEFAVVEYSSSLFSFAKGKISDEDFHASVEKARGHLSPKKMEELESVAAIALATDILSDGVLEETEYRQINHFLSIVPSGSTLRSKPLILKIRQLNAIALLRQSRWDDLFALPPQDVIDNPGVILQKDEHPIWRIPRVRLLEQVHKRTYVGGSAGISVRVFRGVYVRTGAFKGTPLDESSLQQVAFGHLLLTNLNLFFVASEATVKIPWRKVVSVAPFSNGAIIHKNTKTPVYLTGFDPWFLVNFASSLPQ